MQQRVQALVRKYALDAQLDWRMSAEPFVTDAGSLTDAMQTAIKAVTGIHAALETGGGTSDGRFIAPTGAQVLEFGPLNATIHQVDERVSCDDLDSLSSIYEHLLEQLLGDTHSAST
jgi:succinyl-diaminopimelate desuccinylase